jgi:hypothetical protein
VLQVKSNSSGVELKNCLFAGSSNPGRSGVRTEADNVQTPGYTWFENPGRDDYRLRDGVAAINACQPLAQVTADFNGYPRDGRPDAGAFEYGSTPAFPAAIHDVSEAVAVFPNPFNHGLSVSFPVTRKADTKVRVLDMNGRVIWSVPVKKVLYGVNTVTWRGKSSAGRPVPGGVYVVQVRQGRKMTTKRVVLLK